MMHWNKYPESKPTQSGSFLVTISRKRNQGNDFIFNYNAHYDLESDSWHKNDPWNDDESKGEKITDTVLGWMSGLAVFLG